MKCRNKACGHDTFKVVVEHRVARRMIQHDPALAKLARLPVKLICAKCGHQVDVWLYNHQIAESLTFVGESLVALKETMDGDMKALLDFMIEKKRGPLSFLRS